MWLICETESLFEDIVIYLQKLSDGKSLSELEDKEFRSMLDKYWAIKCPSGKTCRPNNCLLAKPILFIEYHGYKSVRELLDYFEYEEVEVLKIKDRKSTETLDVRWARRKSHYNP